MKVKLYFSLLLVALAWGAPLLPATVAGTGTTVAAADIVVSYTLVNADTDTDILTMTPGIALNLATLPTRNLNIRANTNPATVGSVVFNLTGTVTRTHTENVVPYALFSDLAGDYDAWVPPVGSYTLVATPYDATNGAGTAGTALLLNFTVINTIGSVSSFTLVNADTDADILTMTNGMTINLSALGTNRINIRANSDVATSGSVTFDLLGPETRSSVENIVPYALFSDLAGDYNPWTPTPGTYTLTATPTDARDGGGAAGVSLTIRFTIAASGPLAVQLTAFTAEAQGAAGVLLRWATASEENNREFEVQRSADGKLFTVLNKVAGHGSSSLAHEYSYPDKQLPANTATLYYRLRQVDFDGKAAFSPVRVVAVAMVPHATALEVFSTLATDGLLHYNYFGPSTGTESLELYNMLGQRCGQYQVPTDGSGTVPVAGLPPGTYVLRLVSATSHYTTRFVLP